MSDLLASGVQLMLVGMGTVFAFLTLLVFTTLAMSRLVQRFAPPPAPAAPTAPSGVPTAHVAAISAALSLHRDKHRRKKGSADE